MDVDFRILSRQLAPMINIMKDLKDDNNATNAKHNETNENVGKTLLTGRFILLTVVRIYQIQQKRRMDRRRNEDWNNLKEESQRRNELQPTW